ncbi:MarR family transcriptional regulator [Pluralibacter gergoviae]|uniref:MarR family transcriptional regulator n=1 Tax=Pluralibacter gergoviae TaxID=61647 RepID=UPI003EE12BA5
MDSTISPEALLRRRDIIKGNENFLQAIKEHYAINDKIYKQQPLFYKTILQESRFNIVLSICCFVFGNQASCVSEIKTLCARYKIASPNSVIALVTLLKTSGRITTWRSSDDRRKVLIAPTQKGLDELKRYMAGAFRPVGILYPTYNINLDLLDNENMRHGFFRRAAEYLFRGVTFSKIYPEISLFIDKDGGRMIALHLYLQAVAQRGTRGAVIEYSASALAKEFFVSRIHVSRMIKAAENAGYLRERKDGLLDIFPAFMQLVENYVGLYLAYTTHYLNIHPRSPK